MDWDDLRFHAVIEHGSLSAAARRLQISQTTVTRRLQALEESLATQLLDRSSGVPQPTDEGRSLLQITTDMATAYQAIEQWRQSLDSTPSGLVKIAAAGWIGRFLANHHELLTDGLPDVELEIVTGYAFVNLAQREADIAIRNSRPVEGRFASRRLISPHFAVYGSRSYVEENPAATDEARQFADCDWVGYVDELMNLPDARWLAERLPAAPRLRYSSGLNLLDGVKAGVGLGVIPYFIGEPDQDLVRVSQPIEFPSISLWLVMHEEMRRVPKVRAVADRVTGLFKSHGRDMTFR